MAAAVRRPPLLLRPGASQQLHLPPTQKQQQQKQKQQQQQGGPPALFAKPILRYAGTVSARAAAGALATDGVSIDKAALLADTLQQRPPPPSISKSDEAFWEAGVEFVWGAANVELGELNDLFQKVGFPRRDPERLAFALRNTHRTIWIRSVRKTRMCKEGALLGFARATSDGALSATIWDVAVAPAWQRIGLGRAMVERLTASLVAEGIFTVTLYAEPNVVGMYERLGFVKDPDGIKGLAWQSKSGKLRIPDGRRG